MGLAWFKQCRATIRSDRGQALVEYALICGFVALTLVGALSVLSDRISAFLNTAISVLNSA